MNPDRHLASVVVLAKCPRPGYVKTRLTPPLTPREAAAVAAAALRDTLRVVAAAPARARVLSFDVDDPGWLPPGWIAHRQPAGGLDVRIASAVQAGGPGPVLLVGMDTPQITVADLTGFDSGRHDACLGLADDGGYWAIGFRDPAQASRSVHGVAMSTARTGADQLERLQAAGMRVQLLARHTDVDTIDSAIEVARAAPRTEFAQALRQLSAGSAAS